MPQVLGQGGVPKRAVGVCVPFQPAAEPGGRRAAAAADHGGTHARRLGAGTPPALRTRTQPESESPQKRGRVMRERRS